MNKIEKITPQIAALYLGQKCDVKWLYTDTVEDSFKAGDVFHDSKIGAAHASGVERGEISITPYLRRLDSITEQEAREIYKAAHGITFNWPSALTWWNNPAGNDYRNSEIEIGTPAVWLYLLGKGFDLFFLIDFGLAIETK